MEMANITPNNSQIQKVIVAKNGTDNATRKRLNFIEGSNISITVADNPGSDRVDITFTGSASSSVSSVFGRNGVVTAQSGDYNTSQVTETTNLYYTQGRFNTAFSAKSTSDLSEGSNLYFTNLRAIGALPSQTGNSGKVLGTDGSVLSWVAGGAGTFAALTDLTNSFPPSTVKITSTQFEFESISGADDTLCTITPTSLNWYTENTGTGAYSELSISSLNSSLAAGLGAANATMASLIDGNGFAFNQFNGGLRFIDIVYSSSITELEYGHTSHVFNFAPAGNVVINKVNAGSLFYVSNNCGSSITFIQDTTELFNGDTTYVLDDGETAVFYQGDASGIFGVQTLGAAGGGGGTPGGSDKNIQFNDGGAFSGESTFVYDKTKDAVGIQVSTQQAALHVAAITGAGINNVVTGSISLVDESIPAPPTASITQIAEFAAPSSSGVTQNTGGTGFIAQGQVFDYRFTWAIFANSSYYISANSESITYTDGINDSTTPFSNTLTWTGAPADATHVWIERQVNGGGFNDSVIVAVADLPYEDSGFSGTSSTSIWPSQYYSSYTNATAPSSAGGSQNSGYFGLTASGQTWEMQIDPYVTINGTNYSTGSPFTATPFTDDSSFGSYGLEVSWSGESGPIGGFIVRVSNDAGATWSYHNTGSQPFVYDGETNTPHEPSAETTWNTPFSSYAGFTVSFGAFSRTSSTSGVTVYSPTYNTYTTVVPNDSVKYIFKHVLSGIPALGYKLRADTVLGITNGHEQIANNFLDIGYSTWVNGTTVTPNSYGFSGSNLNRDYKVYSSATGIYSVTPLTLSTTTTSGSKTVSLSWTLPSGVTTVKILRQVNGGGYTVSKTVSGSSTTDDSADTTWSGNTTVSPTSITPGSGRFDKAIGSTLTGKEPQLSVIDITGSGDRAGIIAFGVATDQNSPASYQAYLHHSSSSGYITAATGRFILTTSLGGAELLTLGNANEFNKNQSNSVHFAIRSQSSSTLFQTRSDRDTIYMGFNSSTPSGDSASSVEIGRRSGGDNNIYLDSGSTTNGGDMIKFTASGSFLGGVGAQGNAYFRKTAVNANAAVAIGAVNGLTQLLLDNHTSPGVINGGIDFSSNNFYGADSSVRKPFLRMATNALGTQNRIPFFSGTTGQLTDDVDLSFDNGNTIQATRHGSGAGSASAPSYKLGSDTTGWFQSKANEWAFTASSTERARFAAAGLSIKTAATATAYLHLGAGTATAGTAPLKINTGTLLTSSEAGAIEFASDTLFFTQTTNTSRHPIASDNNPIGMQVFS